MRLLLVFSILFSGGSALLLNRWIGDCRHCMLMVKTIKDVYGHANDVIPEESMPIEEYKRFIQGLCLLGSFYRYQKEHTAEACEHYYLEHSLSFTALYNYLTQDKDDEEICAHYSQWLVGKTLDCQGWMIDDTEFTICQSDQACARLGAHCCAEGLCGVDC